MYAIYAYNGAVLPEIARFGSVIIRIINGDHNPPHIHVVYNEYAGRFVIKTGLALGEEIFSGSVRRIVKKYIEENRDYLMEKWNEQNS